MHGEGNDDVDCCRRNPYAKARQREPGKRAGARHCGQADGLTSSRETISFRRSFVSPKGTKNSIPKAVPSWVSMATVPT